MKNSDKSEYIVCQTFNCYLNRGGNACWVGMRKMEPGFVDFPNFAHGFGFARKEAISEAREFLTTHHARFREGCDTGSNL